jgi:hypothetical protein
MNATETLQFEQMKRERDAYRFALLKERDFLCRFMVPRRDEISDSWKDGFVEVGSLRFDAIGFVYPADVSNALLYSPAHKS